MSVDAYRRNSYNSPPVRMAFDWRIEDLIDQANCPRIQQVFLLFLRARANSYFKAESDGKVQKCMKPLHLLFAL
jgi:hypothetical protein